MVLSKSARNSEPLSVWIALIGYGVTLISLSTKSEADRLE